MTVKGFDFSFSKPTPEQVKEAGGEFIIGYFSTDPAKDLTAAEVAAYQKEGLGVVTVWETYANRSNDGEAAGAADIATAESLRRAVGLPAGHVHYMATDDNVTWEQVASYYKGAANTIGQDRIGVYGSFKVVEGAYAAGYRYLWQTDAWSGSEVFIHTTLYQNGGEAFGGSADVDEAYATDYGQSPKPVAKPAPKKEYTVVEGDTLSGIAEKLHIADWVTLYQENRATIGENPNLIKPGEKLYY